MASQEFAYKWRQSSGAYAAQNLDKARSYCSEALALYEELTDILQSYLADLQNAPKEKLRFVDPEITRRVELTAAILQGLPTIEDALLSSSYGSLAALLKQETDGLTRLEEYRLQRHKDGKTPNVKNHGTPAQTFFLKTLQPWAHMSHSDVLEYLAWEVHGETLRLKRWPTFERHTFDRMCDARCHNLTVLIERIEKVFVDAYEMPLDETLKRRCIEAAQLLRRRIEADDEG